jgi:hypothetical protein
VRTVGKSHSNATIAKTKNAEILGSARVGLLEIGVAGGTVGLGIVVQVC